MLSKTAEMARSIFGLESMGWFQERKNALLIKRILGKGSFAKVYLARDSGMHNREGDESRSEEIVLKVLLKANNKPEEDLPLFEKEVNAMIALHCHPNIVEFYGLAWVEDGIDDECIGLPRCAMKLEYCSGGDLHDKISTKRFGENEALHVTQGILRGLLHIHKRGYIHRDIKPENILLCGNGTAKIVDFGLCCHASDEQEMMKRCGSAGYTAPEIILGKVYGQNADCFSLGSLLYFIVSGKLAFNGKDVMSTMKKTVQQPLNFRKSMRLECLSDRCKEFMDQLTMKDPSERPSSKDALQSLCFAEVGSVSEACKILRMSPRSCNAVLAGSENDDMALFTPCASGKDVSVALSDASTAVPGSSGLVGYERRNFASLAIDSIEDDVALEEDSLLEASIEPKKPEEPPVDRKTPLARRNLKPLLKRRVLACERQSSGLLDD